MKQAQIRSDVQESAAPGFQQDLLNRLHRSFNLAQEVGQVGCYEIDMRDGSTFATASFFEHYGLPRDQGRMSRAQWLAQVHPDDREWMLDHLRDFSRSAEVSDVEYRIVRADGEVRWIAARTRLEQDERGEARWAYGVQQDVTDRKRAEDVLRESEARFRTVAEQASDLIYSYDVDAGSIEWFGDVDQVYGYPPGLFPRTIEAWEAHIHPDDRKRTEEALAAHLGSGEPFCAEYRIITLAGAVRYWVDRGTLNASVTGARTMVGAIADVTEQRRSVQNLAESEARFRHLADHLPVMVWLSGASGGITFVSKRWSDFTGRPAADGLGRGWVDSVHPDDAEYVVQLLDALTTKREPYQIDYRMMRRDGEVRWVMGIGVPRYNPDGEFLGFAGSLIDITERKLAEQQAAWSADHDSLTGLANRASFQRELRTGLALAKAAGMPAAVMLFDLDHLKLVNDRLGHDAGDALIRAVAQRLEQAVGLQGMVARLGGDEFGVFLVDIASREDAARQAERLADLLSQPVAHDGSNLDCRGSVGFTMFPDDSRSPEELLKNADLALYEAKSRRRGSMTAYQPAFRSELRRRARSSEDARSFLADDRIVPYYQPRIDLVTGRVAGFEALLRMRSARGKVEPPGRIMSAFEEPGLAVALGERMLDRVLGDIRAWLDADDPFVRVAINASELEFRSGGYADRVLRALDRTGVPPGRLEIEVTETVFVNRQSSLISDELATLSKAGVLLALDDFGTGYASLTHLRRFPVDIIKIDRSFVAGVTDDGEDGAIVQAILGLGTSLGKTVIAEGVETRAQAGWLRAQGCRLAQGYLFARPMPAARAIAMAARAAIRPA